MFLDDILCTIKLHVVNVLYQRCHENARDAHTAILIIIALLQPLFMVFAITTIVFFSYFCVIN